MKYESQVQNVKSLLSGAGKVLIALPGSASQDKLASALALFLALKNSGKEAVIVSPDLQTVAESNLFGIGDIKNTLPPQGAGNFVISLEGVVENIGGSPIVSSLEKLDWFPEGNNLNLVFHIAPGKKFEPTKINNSYQDGTGFNIIFVMGAVNLSDLGLIYQSGVQVFNTAHIVNIDNSPTNGNFGATNIVDSNAATLSEMLVQILPDLGLSLDQDIATNLLTGIYKQSANLTGQVKPDTFFAVGQALQAGGKVPQMETTQTIIPTQTPVQPEPSLSSQTTQPVEPNQTQTAAGFDLRQIFQIPQSPAVQNEPFANPPVVNPSAALSSQPSRQETPTGESTTSSSPEIETKPTPDWLVPKIYKGGQVG